MIRPHPSARNWPAISFLDRFVPALVVLAIHCIVAPDAGASGWSEIPSPTMQAPQSIGATYNGCIAGAATLPVDGDGYMVMHLERNRYYGHPDLVRTIKAMGHESAQRGIGKIQVGDLGQPRGGPMPFGHRSHQTGLDVDVWFNLDPKVYAGVNAIRANVGAPSLLNSARDGLDRAIWSTRHASLLEIAARLPGVDRIFVNPHIKQELCSKPGADRTWLRKIRPWHKHDDHFHLRMMCPPGSPSCERQEAIPLGDGCGELSWWFEPHPPGPPSSGGKPSMPAECRAVLAK